MEPYEFVMPTVTDTLPPKVEKYGWEGENFEIRFSEPVILKESTPEFSDSLITAQSDSEHTVMVHWRFSDPLIMVLDPVPVSGSEVACRLDLLVDYAGNAFEDSLLNFNMAAPPVTETDRPEGGSIAGEIVYSGKKPLMVKAVPVGENSAFYTTAERSKFSFEYLPPGDYTFEAFEILNPKSPQVYFSGLWDRFRPAAEFGGGADTVEVRKRWLIEGITINMRGKGQLITGESQSPEKGGNDE